MNSQLIINALVNGVHYALVALGFGVVLRVARFFHFAQATVYTVAAYAAFLTSTRCEGVILPIIVGVSIAASLGVIMEAGIYGPLRRTRASPTILLVASLGVLIVAQSAISIAFGDETKSMRLLPEVSQGLQILGVRVTGIQAGFLVVATVEVSLLALILERTSLGTALRAVAADRGLAETIGINCDRAILVSFLVGSLLAASAGVFWAYNTALNPQMGFTPLLMGMVAAIIGGVGSVRGAILGAVLIASCQQLALWWLPGEWQDAAVFAVLIAFLLLRPQGFLGKPFKISTT